MATLKSKQTSIATVRKHLRTVASLPTSHTFHKRAEFGSFCIQFFMRKCLICIHVQYYFICSHISMYVTGRFQTLQSQKCLLNFTDLSVFFAYKVTQRHNIYFRQQNSNTIKISKYNANDRRKFDIIVIMVRLYSAGGRQVYHITRGCFQWGTSETVVGMGKMGMDNTAWRGLHRTRGGTA